MKILLIEIKIGNIWTPLPLFEIAKKYGKLPSNTATEVCKELQELYPNDKLRVVEYERVKK